MTTSSAQKIIIFSILATISILFSVLIVSLPLPVILIAVSLLVGIPLTIQSPHITLTLLLTLAPLRTLIATEANLLLPLDIGQVLLFIYLGSWLVSYIYHAPSKLDLQLSVIFKVLIIVIVAFGFNIWSATSISSWLSEWLKWGLITFFVWQIDFSEKYTWRWLIFAFLTSAVANALVGLYIFFGGSGADHLIILGRFFRAFGTFGQPNPFGGFMGIALPIALMCTYNQLVTMASDLRSHNKVSLKTLLYSGLPLIVVIILLAGLIASWSRGAWLGFAVSVMVMAFAIPRKLSTSILMTSGLTILVLGLWFGGLIPQSVVDRITTAATDFITIDEIRGVDITTVNYAVVERIAHWQAALNMAEANPIMGVGLGNYEIVYENYRLLNWTEPLGHAHNYYLNILAETGIIGFLVYIIFWIVIFRTTWRIRQHPDQFPRAIGIGLLGTWSYIAIHSLFDNLYVNNLFLHIGLLLGILAVLNRQVGQTFTLE